MMFLYRKYKVEKILTTEQKALFSIPLDTPKTEQFVRVLDVQYWPKKKLNEGLLAISKHTLSKIRNDAVFHLILNELNSRRSARSFLLSLIMSISLPLLTLYLSIEHTNKMTRQESKFDEQWLQQQNKNHTELISVLRELPRENQELILKALKTKTLEEGKEPANAKK